MSLEPLVLQESKEMLIKKRWDITETQELARWDAQLARVWSDLSIEIMKDPNEL